MRALKKILSLFQDKREILDLSSFGNELAFKTSWEPLARGGTNFCTHRLRKRACLMGDELVFTTTAGAYVFASIFAALGAIFCIVSAAGGFVDMSGVMGLAFFAFGFWYLWHLRQKECKFDRYSRKLIQGKRPFDLSKIGAIQLIREYVRGNESNYYSYELNLVCLNGERINIVDHGALRKLREDALILANYLSVPIWDAIDFRLPDSDDLVDGKVEVLRQNLG